MNQMNKPARKFNLEIFENIDSTNAYLQTLPIEKLPRFCLAEQQTKGKGRLGRSWYSPPGQNIYLSCSYVFQKNIHELTGLSLVIGLAVVSVLKEYLLAEQLKVKWPNDIIFANQKLAGILVNMQTKAHEINRAIIGVGLNVNMTCAINKITQWTSMAKILGCQLDRSKITNALIDTMLKYLERFAITGLNDFITEWQQADYLFGHNITVATINGKSMGIAQGIDRAGRLLLKQSNVKMLAFAVGDATICL